MGWWRRGWNPSATLPRAAPLNPLIQRCRLLPVAPASVNDPSREDNVSPTIYDFCDVEFNHLEVLFLGTTPAPPCLSPTPSPTAPATALP